MSVVSLAADENIHAGIVAGLRLRLASVDIVTVQEAGLTSSPDDVVLAWAAAEHRVLLTNDLVTMPAAALSRVYSGLDMPGVVLTRRNRPTRELIEALITIATAGEPRDFASQVRHLPPGI